MICRVTIAIGAAIALGLASAAAAQTPTSGPSMNLNSTVSPDEQTASNDPNSEFGRAIALIRQENWREAKAALDVVIEFEPRNPKVWRLYGEVGAGRKDMKAAKRAYERAVKLDPDNVEGRYGLAMALANLKDAKAADELAWLKARAQRCGGICPDADLLTVAPAQVEALIASKSAGG